MCITILLLSNTRIFHFHLFSGCFDPWCTEQASQYFQEERNCRANKGSSHRRGVPWKTTPHLTVPWTPWDGPWIWAKIWKWRLVWGYAFSRQSLNTKSLENLIRRPSLNFTTHDLSLPGRRNVNLPYNLTRHLIFTSFMTSNDYLFRQRIAVNQFLYIEQFSSVFAVFINQFVSSNCKPRQL